MVTVAVCPMLETAAALEPLVRNMFELHWRHPGYTCPNAEVYPWQWLWDSCFHAIVWVELGDADRAVQELRTVVAGQDPITGFVPHVGYHGDQRFLADFWGRDGFSSITQPPVLGHALMHLVRGGIDVPEELVAHARANHRFLLERRARTSDGLVTLVHPWESGADDSPRWDDLVDGEWNLARWREVKGELLATVERTPSGAPVANPAFGVASAAFNAVLAFDAAELARLSDDEELAAQADELAHVLADRWDDDRDTWVDSGPTSAGSGGAATLEGLLPALVDVSRRRAVAAQIAVGGRHHGRFGPTGVARTEPTFAPGSYWRGPTWPQLDYLLWRAFTEDEDPAVRDAGRELAVATAEGALRSGLAEYWDADAATGGGAAPQSWTALAWVMASSCEMPGAAAPCPDGS